MKNPCKDCITFTICKSRIENMFETYSKTWGKIHPLIISRCIEKLNCNIVLEYLEYNYNKYTIYRWNLIHMKKLIILFFFKYKNTITVQEKLNKINHIIEKLYNEKSM